MDNRGSVIKLFKILDVGYKGLSLSLFDVSNNILQKYTNDNFDKINLNFRHNDWSYNKLINHLKSGCEKIETIEAYGKNKRKAGFLDDIYSSHLIYSSKDIPDVGENIVNLTLLLDNHIINNDETAECIFKEYARVFNFEYGYIFDIKKNQDIDQEDKKIKEWFFTVRFPTIDKNYYDFEKKLTEIKNGFVPKIYRYNLLNNNQVETLKVKDIIKINDELNLYINNDIKIEYRKGAYYI